MVYLLFAGLVIFAAMLMPQNLSKWFLFAALVAALASGLATKIACGIGSLPVSIFQALKASMLSLIAMGLVVVFSFQVLMPTFPLLFVAFPILVFIAAVSTSKVALSTTFGMSVLIGALHFGACYLAIQASALVSIGSLFLK